MCAHGFRSFRRSTCGEAVGRGDVSSGVRCCSGVHAQGCRCWAGPIASARQWRQPNMLVLGGQGFLPPAVKGRDLEVWWGGVGPGSVGKIGRASCRERVYVLV